MDGDGMHLRSGYVVRAQPGMLPSPEAKAAFEEGMQLIMRRWTALGLAVENMWGGVNSQDKANQLMQDIINWFYEKREHWKDVLEECLDDSMLHDFNVECEDGSQAEVAGAMVQLYEEIAAGKADMLNTLRAQVASEPGAKKSKKQVIDADGTLIDGDVSDSDDDDDGDDDDMDVGMEEDDVPPKAEPIIDEDGFEMVVRNKKGGRRR
ncbi:unnamed protein product [Pedinophyceae sp. YPF-701]|nr:unnamed protein product [Pedinophyceae sp. YPF-701]